jgi:PAS domain S-box-containing protein
MNVVAFFRARPEQHNHWLAIGVTFVLAFSLTISSWKSAREEATTAARGRFDVTVAQTHEAVRNRVQDYEQVLRGAAALFSTSGHVQRDDFRMFVQQLRLTSVYGGITSLAFAPRVRNADRAAHVQGVRAEGLARYDIRPPGERTEYFPVLYIEPFSTENQRAFGFDGFTDPVRRQAMQRARDRGTALMSERLVLEQERSEHRQPGLVLYMPVYQKGFRSGTEEERRNALTGFVTVAFRVSHLMRGIVPPEAGLRLQVYDGRMALPDGLMFDSHDDGLGFGVTGTPLFLNEGALVVNGRPWYVRITSTQEFESEVDQVGAGMVLAVGTVLSLMLTALVALVSGLRRRAVALARQMTADLRESRERLGLALEASNLAFFDWDVKSSKVTLSERWRQMIGGGSESLHTTMPQLQSLVHHEDVRMVQEKAAAILDGSSRQFEAEYRVAVSGGEWRWLLTRAKVVERDEAGNARRVIGTNADVSERKEIERIKNEFISTVSHELRTPLTAIVGSLNLLQECTEGKLGPDESMFLEMAVGNSDRLTALINDVLDIEKIEAGGMPLDIRPLGLRTFLERCVSLNRGMSTRYGVSLELAEVPPEVTVMADEERLMQVMTNLVSNAIKFSPKDDVVRIVVQGADTHVRIEVRDRGPGIPDEFRTRMFQKFAQADGSNTRKKGGTGLGLAISKTLTERMNGRIGFEPNPEGKGTVFFVEVPIAAVAASAGGVSNTA